jgi:hypothetical protein
MDDLFRQHVEAIVPKMAALRDMVPVTVTTLPRVMPTHAVYLFSENGNHLYVGRTNRLRKRLRNHCRPSATRFQATFAFRLAREATGNLRATYKTAGSRAALVLDPAFAQAFLDAKARVRAMNVRFVDEPHALRQCLLEIYAAVVLKTRYNDFDNH